MKRVLFLLIVIMAIFASSANAQERRDTPKQETSSLISDDSLVGSFKLNKNSLNPTLAASQSMLKASKFKTTSFALAVACGASFLFDPSEDYKDLVRTAGIVAGGLSVLFYAAGLRHEWLAGRYLKMSATPGGVTATITF